MTQLHDVKIECVCGDTYGGRAGSQWKIRYGAEDFWKLHRYCEKDDESLQTFEDKILGIFPDDDNRVWSQKYKYISRRIKAFIEEKNDL